MANLNGYIKIHRRLLNWGWYSDSVVKDVFLHLILTANFKEQEWMGRTIGRGQVVTSYAHLAADLGFSVKQVRTALDKLKKTGEVASESTNRFTIITIENWEKYQSCDEDEGKPEGKQEAIKGQTEGKQEASKGQQRKNDKKDKNDKKGKKYIKADAPERFFPEDEKLEKTFRDFINHREALKKPMTENAAKLMIGKLEKMTTSNSDRVLILEESMMNGWIGIFPLKEGQRARQDAPSERVIQMDGKLTLDDF